MALPTTLVGWKGFTHPSGIALSIVPGDPTALVQLQRTIETSPGSGTPDAAAAVDVVTNWGPLPKAGRTYIDQLPVDDVVRFYRARHVGPRGDPGPWTDWTPGAKPVQLSPAIVAPILGGGGAVYPIIRGEPLTDGDYTGRFTDPGGTTGHTTLKESGGKTINRLYAKALAGDADSLDSVVDGGTYARILLNRLASGVIKRAGAFDDGSYAVLASATDGLTTGSTVKESGGKAMNRLLAKALAGDADSLDGTPDGTTYKRITSVSGGLAQIASIVARSRCRVYMSGALSVVTGTLTTVGFDTEDYDPAGIHDPATNNSRITIPTGGDVGVWLFIAQAIWPPNATGGRGIAIARVGTTIAQNYLAAFPGGVIGTAHECSIAVNAPTVGDYFEVKVYQSSGGNLNLLSGNTGTWFQAIHMW